MKRYAGLMASVLLLAAAFCATGCNKNKIKNVFDAEGTVKIVQLAAPTAEGLPPLTGVALTDPDGRVKLLAVGEKGEAMRSLEGKRVLVTGNLVTVGQYEGRLISRLQIKELKKVY